MNNSKVEIKWPNGNKTCVKVGSNWLDAAVQAGISIPTGCLKGSCGACEIEVNGETIRACINKINTIEEGMIEVTFTKDPYW